MSEEGIKTICRNPFEKSKIFQGNTEECFVIPEIIVLRFLSYIKTKTWLQK